MSDLNPQPDSHSATRAPGWKISLADLLSILICFFLLLFATHTLTKEQLQYLSDTFAKRIVPNRFEASVPDRSVRSTQVAGVNLDYLKSVIAATFGSWESLKALPIRTQDGALAIGLPYAQLFSPDGSFIGNRTTGLIPDLAAAMERFNNRIQVLVTIPETESHDLGESLKIGGILAREVKASGYRPDIAVVAGYTRTSVSGRSLALIILPVATSALR